MIGLDPFSLETQVRLRHEDLLRQSAQARLVREARQYQARTLSLRRQFSYWLGARLVELGYHLLKPAHQTRRASVRPAQVLGQGYVAVRGVPGLPRRTPFLIGELAE